MIYILIIGGVAWEFVATLEEIYKKVIR